MKFTLTHVHRNSATDRTTALSRVGAILLSALLVFPAMLPSVAALGASAGGSTDAEVSSGSKTSQTMDVTVPTTLSGKQGVRALADPESVATELTDTLSHRIPPEASPDTMDSLENTSPDGDTTLNEDAILGEDNFDPSLPVTQELLARRMEGLMDLQARGGTRIYYPWPSGAMAVDLYKDGRQILKGQVADIGGTVYVPVQRFADLFGSFKTVYTQATEQVVITGANLSITVKVGDPYITVNERIFYTGKKVLSLGGWIFVPLTSMCKALNATVTIRSGYYDATVTSGDPTKVKWASEYYDSTDLYWLSRIISAEARGEPFTGQIAVGNVVLNRVRSSQFPNTVKGVVFDTKYGVQFSPVSSGTIYNTPTSSAVMAAKICLEGYSLSTQMIYFYNPSIATSSWIGRTRPYIMTIGNHKFYG
ncbi:MAG: cell wall hydrolase [Clostridia bacterium]|nr:cell wall hydrolase [Clostridia bacterium]